MSNTYEDSIYLQIKSTYEKRFPSPLNALFHSYFTLIIWS